MYIGATYNIDAQQGIAHISGKVNVTSLLKMLAKAGRHAELCWVDFGNHDKSTMQVIIGNNNSSNQAATYNGYNHGYVDHPHFCCSSGYAYGHGCGQYGSSRRDYSLDSRDHIHEHPDPYPTSGVPFYDPSTCHYFPQAPVPPEDFNYGDPQWCAIM